MPWMTKRGPAPPRMKGSPRAPLVLDGDCVHHEQVEVRDRVEVGTCRRCGRVKQYQRQVDIVTRWADDVVGSGLPLPKRVPIEDEGFE